MLLYNIVINVSKSINTLLIGILVFFKLTHDLHFSPFFNYKAPIVIFHIEDFFNKQFKHNKGGDFFLSTWTRGYYVSKFMDIIK
jgi:hypothetical protein